MKSTIARIGKKSKTIVSACLTIHHQIETGHKTRLQFSGRVLFCSPRWRPSFMPITHSVK